MRVTRLNFKEEFPKIVELLRTCEFYSVDLEMTGIDREDTTTLDAAQFPQNCRFLRTAEDVFAAKNEAARHFSPMQLGFSLFHLDSKAKVPPFVNRIQASVVRDSLFNFFATGDKEATVQSLIAIEDAALQRHQQAAAAATLAALNDETEAFVTVRDARKAIAYVDASAGAASLDGYTAYSFSCHVFPGFELGQQQLTLSTETIGGFLASNNMDFNAWIKESLKYVARERVAALRREKLSAVPEPIEAKLLRTVPGPHKKTVQMTFTAIDKFAATAGKEESKKVLPFLADDAAYKAVLGKLKAAGLKATGGGFIAFDELSGAAEVAGDGADLFHEDQYQATLLFEAMVACRRPIVLHNSYSDLLFLYHAFSEQPLQTYAEFKSAINTMFPVVYDTRTLSSLDVMGKFGNVRGKLDTTHELFARQHLGRTVNINLPIAFGFDNGAHDAGYDAFITGSLFLFASKELENLNIPRARFQGVVPVYGSVFSISLETPNDVMVHAPGAPVLWATPAAGQTANKIFMNKVQSFLKDLQLPGVTLFNADSILFFAARETLQMGLDYLEDAVEEAVRTFLLGGLQELDVVAVCTAKGMTFVSTIIAPQ